MPNPDRSNFTLRLDTRLLERVDALLKRDPTTSSRNDWIARAVFERVEREEAKRAETAGR